jgi:hypothetical protein
VRARHRPDFEWRLERESCIVNPVKELRAEYYDHASPAAGRARCGPGPVTLSAPAAVAIGVDAGDKAAAEARDSRMERLAYALHEDAALVLCRGCHGTRKSPRCLDVRDHNSILTSVGRRVAPAPGRASGSKVS